MKIKSILMAMAMLLLASSPALAAPNVSVKIVGKQNVVINFSGIKSLKTASYELTYSNNGKEEGVVGTIKPKKDRDSRTIYLGTCSKKVCTPHKKITNGKLNIIFKTMAGVTTKKSYKLKI